MYDLNNKENIEWTNSWVEQAQSASARRILLLGDSVTREFRSSISNLLPAYAIDFVGMSFSLEDNMLYRYLNAFLSASEYEYELCLLNIGAKHGYYLDTKHDVAAQKRFEIAYTRLIDFVKAFCPNILILSVTASVLPDKLESFDIATNDEIQQRNFLMAKLTQKYNIPFIDLYEYCKKERFKYRDSMHFSSPKTQKAIAQFIITNLVALKKNFSE